MLIQSFTCRGSLWVEGVSSGRGCLDYVRAAHQLPASLPIRLQLNGRPLKDLDASLEPDSVLHVLPAGGLPGGKGGFGSMLRAIGAQIERTTNHEAMRDLSGRRQRDVNKEARLKDYLSKEGERRTAAEEKKKNKIEKLRRLAAGENKGKHDFSDPAYDKARSETEEKVHEAVEAAMASSSSTAAAGTSTASSSGGVANSTPAAGGQPELKRAAAPAAAAAKGPSPKKAKGLWLGAGLDDLEDDEDLSSDSEDDEVGADGGRSKEVAVLI